MILNILKYSIDHALSHSQQILHHAKSLSSDTVALTVTGIIGLVLFVYFWVLRPLNRIRRLGDVGQIFGQLEGVYKERQMERLKKLRQIGDLPPVFANGWFCVAESSEIKRKEIKQITVFGELLSLVRSENGEVFIMDAYCPHLGANFNIGGRVVNDNCVQCPFHGWIFDASTGKCVDIPYNTGSIPEQAKVDTWPVIERNCHIYIWYHAEGLGPQWYMEEIPEIASGEWTYGGRTEHEILCHCQEIPENGADLAHLCYLHNSGPQQGSDITKSDLSLDGNPWITHQWEGNWAPLKGEDSHIGVMHLNQVMKLFGQFDLNLTKSKLIAEQVGPGIVHMKLDFGIWGKGIVFQHITPEEPLLQRARFVMYSTCSRFFAKFFMISEATQFERDIYVWGNKSYKKNPLLVKNDGPIQQHRRWFNQFYTENSPRLLKNGELSNKCQPTLDW